MKRVELQRKQVEELGSELTQGLKEIRYFIVLDDLWKIHDWNWIKSLAFPEKNNQGSRIIVTTRDAGLAKIMCTSLQVVYHLEPLKYNNAKQLLLRKTNKTQEDLEKGNLDEIFNKILRKCGGLPLAIVTIGGVLATKHVEEWRKFYEQLPSELERNPNLGAIKNIVSLSYTHLPSHLKPCLLYLSIFPEDFEIHKSRLVNRWIAEGFIVARAGMTIEEVGNSYFIELINQSMIQPSKQKYDGTITSCQVHDIIHDIIVSISRDEAFTFFTMENDTSTPPENVRHLALQELRIICHWIGAMSVAPIPQFTLCQDPLEIYKYIKDELKTIQSFLRAAEVTKKKDELLMIRNLKSRVEELSNRNTHYNLINPISSSATDDEEFLDRRYFETQRRRLVDRWIAEGFVRARDGMNIEDLGNRHFDELINRSNQTPNLRSLYRTSGYGYFNIMDNPKECVMIIVRLPMIFSASLNFGDRLKLISEIIMAWHALPVGLIQRVPQIRSTQYSAQLLRSSLLTSLQSLCVDAEGFSDTGTLEWVNSIVCPPFSKRLKLNGSLVDTPNWFGNLNQLVKMYLSRCGLKEGKTMEILGALPNLTILRLYHNAYADEKIAFRRGTFPNLSYLDIYLLKQLREIRFDMGTSPKMESIEIYGCKLASGIISVKRLPRLKIISLEYDAEVANFDMFQEEWIHTPIILNCKWQSTEAIMT
uniref:Uncharacterized protein n=1 Tax=Leersia perrieri TaxID=77586 RepID=A0A0D9WPD1_9ORYZ